MTYREAGVKPELTSYELPTHGGEGPGIKIVRVWQGKDRWAVRYSYRRLNRDGEWEPEPQPSSRSDEFKARTTFTRVEALRMAEGLEVMGA